MNVSALIVVGLYVVLLIAVRPFGSLEDMVQLRTALHDCARNQPSVHKPNGFSGVLV